MQSSLSAGVPLADRYLLIEELGAGGMAVVWRGYDEVLGRPVAIKVLASPIAADPAFREVIQREARSAARLSHPHVTHVYDYGEATVEAGQTVPYVVMELLEGHTLNQRLHDGPLPWKEAVRICGQVADALAAAHRRGIVHRDIAPANIMLTSTGAKVLDFGISALAGGRGDPEGSTLLGTPAYVAPERLDDAPAAPAADVYALGALLYEALSGQAPVPAGTWNALVEAYKSEPEVQPLDIPELPDPIAALIRTCLVRDPAGRPSAAKVSRTLIESLQPAPADSVPTATNPPIRATVPRSAVFVSGAFVSAGRVSGGRVPVGRAEGAPPGFGPATGHDPLSGRRENDRLVSGTLAGWEPSRHSADEDLSGRGGRQEVTVPMTDRGHRTRNRTVIGAAVAIAAVVLVGIALASRDTASESTGPLGGSTVTASPSLSAAPLLAPASPTSPTPSPTPTAAPRSSTQTVQLLIDKVDAGQVAGQIRPDAALDLDNLLHNLQSQLLSAHPTGVSQQVTVIHDKIVQRRQDGSMKVALADQLLSIVNDIST